MGNIYAQKQILFYDYKSVRSRLPEGLLEISDTWKQSRKITYPGKYSTLKKVAISCKYQN